MYWTGKKIKQSTVILWRQGPGASPPQEVINMQGTLAGAPHTCIPNHGVGSWTRVWAVGQGKHSTCKWTCSVQTCVAQESTVFHIRWWQVLWKNWAGKKRSSAWKLGSLEWRQWKWGKWADSTWQTSIPGRANIKDKTSWVESMPGMLEEHQKGHRKEEK